MAVYVWAGMDRAGKKQKGEIEADNLPLARQMVVRKGIVIKYVRVRPKALGDYFPAIAGKVHDKDKVVFVRQFATMIDAGLCRPKDLVKVLGQGSLSRPVRVSAHAFSETARSAIEEVNPALEQIARTLGGKAQVGAK